MAMQNQLQSEGVADNQLILTISEITLRVDALKHSATCSSCARRMR